MIGKSIYIWTIESIFGGDVKKIAETLAGAGFDSAILHDAHLPSWASEKRLALVEALREAGVMPIGGAAVYGWNVEMEGKLAGALCMKYHLPAFVFDAESTFDAQPHADSRAVKLLQTFKAEARGVKAGWCWWARFKNPISGNEWHPKKILWAAMDAQYGGADFGVPMAYWGGESAANAIHLLEQTWKQWREITDKPICPAGRAYIGDAGTATPEAVTAFEERARELGATGITWWSMQHAVALPEVWKAMVNMPGLKTGVPESDQSQEPDQSQPEVEKPSETEPIPDPTRAVIRTGQINFRKSPEVKSNNRLGVLNRGTESAILERKTDANGNTWLRVSVEGWISEQYGDAILTEVK
jgi:hypothetical protein